MNKQGFGLYLFLCALLICDIAVHCVNAQPSRGPVEPSLRTHQLEIVNHAGVVTAKIDNDAHGNVAIQMYDPRGRKRISVGAANSSAVLEIYNSKGQNDIMIGGGDAPKRSPQVVVYRNNTPSATMYSGIGGRSGFSVFDDRLAVRAALDYQNNDQSEVALFDKNRNKRAALAYYGPIDASAVAVEDSYKGAEMTCEQGDSSVSVSDANNHRAELIYKAQSDKPMVIINDKSGNAFWSAPSPAGGSTR